MERKALNNFHVIKKIIVYKKNNNELLKRTTTAIILLFFLSIFLFFGIDWYEFDLVQTWSCCGHHAFWY